LGTWGAGALENDIAADWVWQIQDAGSEQNAIGVIESALREASEVPADEYLDADAGSCALAAAEVVAAALGRPADDLPENVTEWLTGHAQAVPETYGEKARAAVARTSGANSELAELWAESDGAQEWLAQVRGLLGRLTHTEPGNLR
jgi:hypothetical protein